MAAIMTWFCKATPAGVFAVCPFLLFWLAICPNRAHAHGRPLPPPSCAAVLFFAGKRPRGYAYTRGVFSPGRFLRYQRSRALCAGAYEGGTRAHCTEIPRPYSAATAQTVADSLLTQKAAQQPQKRPQRRQEPPGVHGHTRCRRPYRDRRSPPRRAIAPPSRRRLTSVY